MQYSKPALDIPQQIARLQAIGLQIPDVAAAERRLQYISYFRLKGYFLPFMNHPGPGAARTFFPGTTIDQIVDLYQFDRRLRILVMDEIERLEVAIRTVICNELSIAFNPHWYLTNRQQVFGSGFDTHRFLGTVLKDTLRSKDHFAQHYYATYDHPMLPPSWVVAECTTFGEWSRLYTGLKTHQQQIASNFNLPHNVFGSWVHVLSILRNVCAHHGRLWNRRHPIRVAVLRRQSPHFADQTSCYSRMVVIQILTKAMDSHSDFSARLQALLTPRSASEIAQMGFRQAWHTDPLWT